MQQLQQMQQIQAEQKLAERQEEVSLLRSQINELTYELEQRHEAAARAAGTAALGSSKSLLRVKS